MKEALLHAYFDWQTPQSLSAMVGQHGQRLGEEWKRRVGREFREAFIAAQFADFRNAHAVRLLPPIGSEPTPDFAVRSGPDEAWYEITEIDRPGRLRSDEPPLDAPQLLEADEWVAAADYLEVLRQRSSNKARKRYERCDGLIIYDNAWVKDPEEKTLKWWRAGTVDARTRFAEVWSFDGEFFTLVK